MKGHGIKSKSPLLRQQVYLNKQMFCKTFTSRHQFKTIDPELNYSSRMPRWGDGIDQIFVSNIKMAIGVNN